eukprot:GSMAST32.ASY1.ANO1.2326.1 assembled CDS
MLDHAHFLLAFLMLQRKKGDIDQKIPPKIETRIIFWYKRLLLKESKQLEQLEKIAQHRDNTKNISQTILGNDWKRLRSLLMQLRKCCNHPFLFPKAEASMISDIKQHKEIAECIINASGKMIILDKMLHHLFANGHRIVIFSQFTKFLNIIHDYLNYRKIQFVRLDGSVSRVRRMIDISEFNKPNSPYKVFLMSTRAGGLGVNLQSADTVILMDSDWNPQVDQQAMARVHRIGQKKITHIYRFVSAGTMEERMVQRAEKKLFLDTMVNKGGSIKSSMAMQSKNNNDFTPLSFGVDRIFDSRQSSQKHEKTTFLSDEDILEIIQRKHPNDINTPNPSGDTNVDYTTTTDINNKNNKNNKNFETTNPNPSLNPNPTGHETKTNKKCVALSYHQKNTTKDFDENLGFVALREFEGKHYSRFGTKCSTDSRKSIDYIENDKNDKNPNPPVKKRKNDCLDYNPNPTSSMSDDPVLYKPFQKRKRNKRFLYFLLL